MFPQFEVHVGPGALAKGAPNVLKRGPAEAVESFDTTVLLMKLTAKAS